MSQNLEAGRCGLDFNNAKLRYNDSKNFGPQKYRVNTADVFCEVTGCQLALGVEVRFPTITAPTIEELKSAFIEEANTQESRVSEALLQTRLIQCPFLQNQLGRKTTG